VHSGATVLDSHQIPSLADYISILSNACGLRALWVTKQWDQRERAP
jgi:hypothetical protein